MNRIAILVGVLVLSAAAVLYTTRYATMRPPPDATMLQARVRTPILPAGAAAPIAPYTPAIGAGDFVFLSGQIGIDPATGSMVEGGIVPEIRQVLANIRTLLTAAGLTFNDVVRATVYLADLDDYAALNEEYGKVFDEAPPARVAVQVARLPLDARVEISMIAYRSGG